MYIAGVRERSTRKDEREGVAAEQSQERKLLDEADNASALVITSFLFFRSHSLSLTHTLSLIHFLTPYHKYTYTHFFSVYSFILSLSLSFSLPLFLSFFLSFFLPLFLTDSQTCPPNRIVLRRILLSGRFLLTQSPTHPRLPSCVYRRRAFSIPTPRVNCIKYSQSYQQQSHRTSYNVSVQYYNNL